ncbi:unnamed protein product [Paramecium sonneborni]|uniref:Uncharacterized protein n=1 Tax=Paramecium sonneborni TaxID=65129 RepID=A0A8S1RNE4_9CILI|nr:unnamed protein product [Paramecium sonneborni]
MLLDFIQISQYLLRLQKSIVQHPQILIKINHFDDNHTFHQQLIVFAQSYLKMKNI